MKTEDKILLAVTTVGILTGISFWFRYSKLIANAGPDTSTGIQFLSPSLKKNWVVYRNALFELSYPPELTFKYDNMQKNSQGKTLGTLLLQNFDATKRAPLSRGIFQIAIFAENDNGKTLAEVAKSEKSTTVKNIKIAGLDAIKGTTPQPSGVSPTVWIINNGTRYTFQFPLPQSSNAAWFDEILSTLRFL